MRSVRFQIDLSEQCSIVPRMIELLETIVRTRSIRAAAREVGVSYRHAWLLLDDLNRSFTEPVIRASVGGAGGGGAEITDLGTELIRQYRNAGKRIDSLARSEFAAIARKVRDPNVADVTRRQWGKRKTPRR